MGLMEASKFLSLILRHKPEVIGVSLDEHGWAEADKVILGVGRTREPEGVTEISIGINQDK